VRFILFPSVVHAASRLVHWCCLGEDFQPQVSVIPASVKLLSSWDLGLTEACVIARPEAVAISLVRPALGDRLVAPLLAMTGLDLTSSAQILRSF